MDQFEISRASVVAADARSLGNAQPTSQLCKMLGIELKDAKWIRVVDIQLVLFGFLVKFHYLNPIDSTVADEVRAAVGHVRGTIVKMSQDWADMDEDEEMDFSMIETITKPFVTLTELPKSAMLVLVSRNSAIPKEVTMESLESEGPMMVQNIVQGTAVYVKKSDRPSEYYISTARYIDAKSSSWSSCSTFGEIFEANYGSDFFAQLGKFNGENHKFIIRSEEMDLMDPVQGCQIVYAGSVIGSSGEVVYHKKMPFATNPFVDYTGQELSFESGGYIFYTATGVPVATVYSESYKKRMAIWGDAPSIEARIAQIFFSPKLREFTRNFADYAQCVRDFRKRYDKLLNAICIGANRRQRGLPANLSPGLWYILKNTAVGKEDDDAEILNKIGETFRRLTTQGEYSWQAFLKTVMNDDTNTPRVAPPKNETLTFKKIVRK